MRSTVIRSLSALPVLVGLAGLTACTAEHASKEQSEIDENAIDSELTSNTALSRSLKFQGTVYVADGASDYTILAAVKRQTQSAFGALRTSNVGVNSRELKDVDPSTFVKTKVSVVDTSKPGSTPVPMLRVTYTYTDNALVPKTMSRRSSLQLALLNGQYSGQSARILTECTDNDKEANEFVGSIWYVFKPSLSSCKSAIAAEQKTIDAARQTLKSTAGQVPLLETQRLYVPMTVALTGNKTNKGTSYPEYDRLYSQGVQKGKLTISMVSGMMADWAAGEHHDTIDDDGYDMWFEGLREVFAKRPEFKLAKVEGGVDLSTFDAAGTKVTGATFADLMKWELDQTGFPGNIPSSKQHALRVAVGEKLVRRWITFEAPVTVQIGSGPAQSFVIQLNTYFGAETDPTPHKWGIKNSDVFIYNGHSYIGYGPLDPSHFSPSDFPAGYQIMFINGCVSYNYYEKDYLPLKAGGTRNLELVTNGLESWVNGSGPAMGRFVGALIDGKQESYSALLTAAQFTGYGYAWGQDALRVVDGELDNVYSPTTTPIVVKSR
jgi:hypothetical protein